MSEPLIYLAVGFLFAIPFFFGAKLFARSRVGRLARKRLEAAAPKLMADIDADMGQLHAQIAVATRRLETSVEQMKIKTTGQLSELGKTSESIARLKAEHDERVVALQALAAKEKKLNEQMFAAAAELTVKTGALEEVERKLAIEKAELKDLMAFVDARDKLAETESRHTAALEGVKAENAGLEEQLLQAREERTRLEQEMAILKRQVESTWASERMANALLRERINDVAGEVVRVAHALEGLSSPIDTMLAGKATEIDPTKAEAAPGTTRDNKPSNGPAGDDSKGMLAHRIRSLQKRAARVSSSGST